MGTVKCPTCNGKGIVHKFSDMTNEGKRCPNCKGTGRIKT